MHILLIEPDVVLAHLYIQALEAEGNTVSFVRSAESAIHIADRKKPDVVILELQLTQHSGVAFLQEFRSYTDWLHIPVIIHTHIPPQQLEPFKKALQEMRITAQLYKPQTTLQLLKRTVQAAMQPSTTV